MAKLKNRRTLRLCLLTTAMVSCAAVAARAGFDFVPPLTVTTGSLPKNAASAPPMPAAPVGGNVESTPLPAPGVSSAPASSTAAADTVPLPPPATMGGASPPPAAPLPAVPPGSAEIRWNASAGETTSAPALAAAPAAIPDLPAGSDAAGPVKGFGRDIPLHLALHQLVPGDYHASIAPGVRVSTPLSWKGGKPWDETLNAALAPHKLHAVVEGSAVRIERGAAPPPGGGSASSSYTPDQLAAIGAQTDNNPDNYPRHAPHSAAPDESASASPAPLVSGTAPGTVSSAPGDKTPQQLAAIGENSSDYNPSYPRHTPEASVPGLTPEQPASSPPPALEAPPAAAGAKPAPSFGQRLSSMFGWHHQDAPAAKTETVTPPAPAASAAPTPISTPSAAPAESPPTASTDAPPLPPAPPATSESSPPSDDKVAEASPPPAPSLPPSPPPAAVENTPAPASDIAWNAPGAPSPAVPAEHDAAAPSPAPAAPSASEAAPASRPASAPPASAAAPKTPEELAAIGEQSDNYHPSYPRHKPKALPPPAAATPPAAVSPDTAASPAPPAAGPATPLPPPGDLAAAGAPPSDTGALPPAMYKSAPDLTVPPEIAARSAATGRDDGEPSGPLPMARAGSDNVSHPPADDPMLSGASPLSDARSATVADAGTAAEAQPPAPAAAAPVAAEAAAAAPAADQAETPAPAPPPAPKKHHKAPKTDAAPADDTAAPAKTGEPAAAKAPGHADMSAVSAWQAEKGASLKSTLAAWCKQSGVTLDWQAKKDFKLAHPVTVEGTLPEALTQLLTSFNDATPRPVGELHPRAADGTAKLIIKNVAP